MWKTHVIRLEAQDSSGNPATPETIMISAHALC